ncbi:MAG TPA: glycosyltransferase family 2 protein [Gemmatimonadota bacterium]
MQDVEHVSDLGRRRLDAGGTPAGVTPAELGRERLPGAGPGGKVPAPGGVSLFVPVYNEEAILAETMPRLLRVAEGLGRELQLVIVDNGSTDSTPAVLERLAEADRRIEPLRLPRPGVGAAMRAALPRFRHPFVLAIDADLTIDLGFVADAVRALDAGADAVIGNKDAGEQRRPLLRLATSKVFTWVMTRGAGFPFHDVSIGAKGYRSSVLRRFEERIETGSKYVLEVLMAAHDAGLRIVEVPVACRDERESRFNLLHEGVHRFGHLFGLVVRRRVGALRPRRALRPPAARRPTTGTTSGSA